MMKQSLTFIFILSCLSLQAQIYVNTNSSGANDGSSWEDAYYELHDALENSQEGDEIWVAAGTYLPQSPPVWNDPDRKSFYIIHQVSLYGGFAGVETSLDERDPDANYTLLSGDLNGDDIFGDIQSNSSDNVLNVVFAEATSNGAIIDGFSIRGGRADGGTSLPSNQRGGGIFTFGPIHIRNCHVSYNSASAYGGGVYFRLAETEGSTIENSVINSNYAGQNGGGVILANVPGVGVQISGTTFLENVASTAGGGLYSSNSESNISDCSFLGNTGFSVGGGMYILIDQGNPGLSTTVNNCNLEFNAAPRGGGINFRTNSSNTDLLITSCDFIHNQSLILSSIVTDPRGGGINVDFSGNSENGVVEIEDCEFIDNEASNWGGGISLYMDAFGVNSNHSVLIQDCALLNNSSAVYGGGIYIYNNNGDKDNVEILNCEIIGNSADADAGGIGVVALNSFHSMAVRNTLFSENSSLDGLAFHANRGSGTNPLPAGQIMELTNCVFTNHTAANDFSFVIGGTAMNMLLQNNTLANNDAGGMRLGIGSDFFIQNNIFQNVNGHETVELLGAGQLNSGGGNLFSDTSLEGLLNNTDLQNTDPQFEAGSFVLSETSPAIDAGVILQGDYPEFDLEGNPRVQGGCIDIGAYESPYDSGHGCSEITTSVSEYSEDELMFSIFPNPVSDELNISIRGDENERIFISIINPLGQVVLSEEVMQNGTKRDLTLNVHSLARGIYQLQIADSHSQSTKSFLKL